jgi:hypothetical protein
VLAETLLLYLIAGMLGTAGTLRFCGYDVSAQNAKKPHLMRGPFVRSLFNNDASFHRDLLA